MSANHACHAGDKYSGLAHIIRLDEWDLKRYMTAMKLPQDLSGLKIGKLTVLKKTQDSKWECLCECGKRCFILGKALQIGTKSCGCLRVENAKKLFTKHGGASASSDPLKKKMFQVWSNIRKRCFTKTYENYHRYGGRGIAMSPEWYSSFETFYRDMHATYSKGLEIERVNNDGNYCKENCKWATHKEECNNRSSTRRLTVGEVTKTTLEWSAENGIPSTVILDRIKRGWDVGKAVSHPRFWRGQSKVEKSNCVNYRSVGNGLHGVSAVRDKGDTFLPVAKTT
jgi:hypothetical protein